MSYEQISIRNEVTYLISHAKMRIRFRARSDLIQCIGGGGIRVCPNVNISAIQCIIHCIDFITWIFRFYFFRGVFAIS